VVPHQTRPLLLEDGLPDQPASSEQHRRDTTLERRRDRHRHAVLRATNWRSPRRAFSNASANRSITAARDEGSQDEAVRVVERHARGGHAVSTSAFWASGTDR